LNNKKTKSVCLRENKVDGFVKTIYYYFVDAFLNEQQETKG